MYAVCRYIEYLDMFVLGFVLLDNAHNYFYVNTKYSTKSKSIHKYNM